ncbi:MAG: hypothetical protein ACD_4C00019G0001, partial [uncultured bacterium (gcode 4)]
MKIQFKIIFIILFYINNCAFSKVLKYDFGNCSSNTLIEKAANCLKDADWEGVDIYTDKCIQLYTVQAVRMQNDLKDFPEDNASLEFWALNHVAFCHFLKGEMYLSLDKPIKAYKEYSIVVKKYPFSICFDTDHNTFWKIAEVCRDKISNLENTFGKEYFSS